MKVSPAAMAWIGLAVFTSGAPLLAQLKDNSEKQLTCDNRGNDGDRARHCEIREQTMAAVGKLDVDGGRNGGATIKGWLRSEVLVRARIDASADTESAAALMASKVFIDGSGGQVRATGPDTADNAWWSVSYEIFVPQTTDLNLKARNGGLTISDVRGQIHFDVNNGGVNLNRVAGDVSGATVNGGIQARLTGTTWEGRQMDVSTRNGGVTLAVPSNYSAHIQAETNSGGIQSDFPLALEGSVRPRRLDHNLGAGGPLIHIATRNGQVSLKRSDTQ